MAEEITMYAVLCHGAISGFDRVVLYPTWDMAKAECRGVFDVVTPIAVRAGK